MTLPAPPNLPQLGQKSNISDSLQIGKFNNSAKFKARVYAMRGDCEREGRGDYWREQQRTLMPDVDPSLIGFCIDMLFSIIEPDGNSYLDW